MIKFNYLKYLLFAASISSLFVGFMWLLGTVIEVWLVIGAFMFAATFTSLITIRLPVFRQYYSAEWPDEIRKYRSVGNDRAALYLTSLLAGVVAALGLYALNVKNIEAPTIVSAITAAIISLYHEKNF